MGDLSLSQFVLNLADQNFDIYNVRDLKMIQIFDLFAK
jgi:hypothetical protein